MQWVVLFLISATAASLACIVVACMARVASVIPWAGVRKWSVILFAIMLVTLVACIGISACYFPEGYRDLWRTIVDDYRALPSYTLLLFVPIVTTAAFYLGALIAGFRPEPFVPYEPRAAYWPLRGLLGWLTFMAGLSVVALIVQDFGLRGALLEQQEKAAATAQELAPAEVSEGDNAAPAYLRAADLADDVDEDNNDWSSKRILYAKLRQASAKPLCRFDDEHIPVHVVDAMDTRYGIVGAMGMLSRLAEYRVCQGRPKEAIDCLRQIRRYEQHMADDPRACEPAFYYWFESWVRQGLEHMSAHAESLPTEELRTLVTTEPLATEKIFRDGIKWHAAAIQQHLFDCYTGVAFDREEFQFQEIFGDRKGRKLPRWLVLAGMRALWARDDMAAVRAIFPFTERPNDPDAWNPHWDDVSPTGWLASSAQSISYLPHWADRAEANRRLTNIAAAAMLYRQDKDAWPATLDALTPDYLAEIEPPGDGEEPFRLKSIDGGMMVYSAELDKDFRGFKDARAWWEEAGEFVHAGYCLFLGRARERLIDFEPKE
jgi:hypothetical protein